MQTFLPYPDFTRSAQVLDRARLGKQRVEAMQIHKALTVRVYGWKQHPAVHMWLGYEQALLLYGYIVSDEWLSRGYQGRSTHAYFVDRFDPDPPMPDWLGDPDVHRSHRSNLLRKLPEHYSQFWQEPDDLPYVWPRPFWPHAGLWILGETETKPCLSKYT